MERPVLSNGEIQKNVDGILKNLKQVLDFECPDVGAKIVNNEDWHGKMTSMDLLRDAGR